MNFDMRIDIRRFVKEFYNELLKCFTNQQILNEI